MSISQLKRKARGLMMPYIHRRNTYDCGESLLREIASSAYADYRKGVAYARLARFREWKALKPVK